METIEPKNLKKDIEAGKQIVILDVREPWEFEAGHIKDAVNLPVRDVNSGILKILSKDAKIVTVCEHGIRSEYARRVLVRLEYSVRSLAGGMEAWRNME